MEYQCASIYINSDIHELRVDGEVVEAEPLIFDALLYLIEHQGATVTKDTLIETVWKGRIVSDTTIATAIKGVRKCIGDNGKDQHYIKTVYGRGFRFIPQVETIVKATNQPVQKMVESANEEDDVPSHISLMVLPFQYSNDKAEIQHIVQSVPTEIERVLGRVALLSISAESTRYSQQSIRPTGRQIYEELGVTYLLDGCVKHIGSKTIVTAQLVDNKSGFKIWDTEFAYSLSNFIDEFELSKKVVLDIVAQAEPQLNRAIFERIKTSRAPRTSRSLYLQANSLLAVKGWRASTFIEAAELLKESSKLDPSFALAPALRSLLLAFGVRLGVIAEREESIKEAVVDAAKALDLDSMDSTVLGYVGCAYCDINMADRGIPLIKNAIRANSANGQAWVALGASEMLAENADEAVKNLEHGIAISPMDNRLAVWRSILSMGYALQHKIDDAIEHATLACQEDVNLYMPRVVLAAVRIMQRQPDKAKAAFKEAFAVKPDLSKREVYALVGKQLGQKLLS